MKDRKWVEYLVIVLTRCVHCGRADFRIEILHGERFQGKLGQKVEALLIVSITCDIKSTKLD